MKTPCRAAAWTSSSPSGALAGFPSSVNATVRAIEGIVTAAPSGHPFERGVDLKVLLALDHAAQALDRLADVGEAGVERREAEADAVGAAVVRDHVLTLDQRAADPPGLRVAEGDVGAAPRRVARC